MAVPVQVTGALDKEVRREARLAPLGVKPARAEERARTGAQAVPVGQAAHR
ncbi:MAG: hypothetical protein ABSB49_04750 [Polyangia bacterium]